MTTVLCKVEKNALTTPISYRVRIMPREVLGYQALAERIAEKNPVWTPGLVRSVMEAENEEIFEQLVNGRQVTQENAFTYHLSVAVRLESPDDPLPPAKEIVRVKARAARPFVERVQQEVRLERLPPEEKQPVIAAAFDTVLRLADVLNPAGLLQLSGTDMLFDPEQGDGWCVIEGTRSGRTVQGRYGTVSDTEVQFLPEIPAQPDPWNNSYRVSVSTRYTEHGTLRTGTYGRPLRTPLAVVLGNDDGILSGSGDTPLVTVSDGTLAGEAARVRIQAVLDAQDRDLRLSLLDLRRHGLVGQAVTVSADGMYSLPGFSGSPLTELAVTVNDYVALEEMVRTEYTGRVVDVLDVAVGG